MDCLHRRQRGLPSSITKYCSVHWSWNVWNSSCTLVFPRCCHCLWSWVHCLTNWQASRNRCVSLSSVFIRSTCTNIFLYYYASSYIILLSCLACLSAASYQQAALGTSAVKAAGNQVLGSGSVHCGPTISFNWRDGAGRIKGIVGSCFGHPWYKGSGRQLSDRQLVWNV